MSYKPEESVLIAYLYGELSEEERRKVEAYLEENGDAKAEMEQMRDTRSILGKVGDRDVQVPSFVFDESPKVVVANTRTIDHFWRRSLAIAASISIIILFGYLAKADFSIGSGGVQLSFGEQSTPNGYSENDVKMLIQAALKENNQQIDEKLNGVQSDMKKLASNNTGSGMSQEQIDTYLTDLRIRSIETLSGLMETSELAQRKYTEDMIREFAIFLDIQRQNDMNVIQTRFDNLIDDTEFNHRQTNQILTNLLTSSGEPSNQY